MHFSLVRAGLVAACIPITQSAPVESSHEDDFLTRSGLAIAGLRAEIPSSPKAFITYTGNDIEDIRDQALASSHPGFTAAGFNFSVIGAGFESDDLATPEDVDDSQPSDIGAKLSDLVDELLDDMDIVQIARIICKGDIKGEDLVEELLGRLRRSEDPDKAISKLGFKSWLEYRGGKLIERLCEPGPIAKRDIKEHKPEDDEAAELSASLKKNLSKPAGFIPSYLLERLRNSSISTNTSITGQKHAGFKLSPDSTVTGQKHAGFKLSPDTTATPSNATATTSSPPTARATTICDGTFKRAKVYDIRKGMEYLHSLPGRAVIAPATCQRVSCSWGAGIYVCNGTPASTNDNKQVRKAEDKARTTRVSFGDIAKGANNILGECWMDYGGWSSGKYTAEDGVTSVIIRGGAYRC